MKKISVGIAAVIALAGCSIVETEDSSIPVQEQGVTQSTSTPSEIAEEPIDEDIDGDQNETETAATTGSNVAPSGSSKYVDASLDLAQPLSTCKLQETANLNAPGPKGFSGESARNWMLPNSGRVKVVIIPVDFSDIPGGNELPKSLLQSTKDKIEAWSNFVSKGKMQYEVVIADQWVRLPKTSDWYQSTGCSLDSECVGAKQSQQESFQQIVDAADDLVDFSNTSFVVPLGPDKAKEFYIYNFWEVTSEEGTFNAFVMNMRWNEPKDNYWSTIIHEVLHPQGFIGHGPTNDTQFTILSNQNAQSKAVSAWEGFINGWYDENEILCLDSESLGDQQYFRLSNFDELKDGFEVVVVRLNSSEAIVIESRGPGPFSTLKPGVLAYRLNVNAKHDRCDMCNQIEFDKTNWWGSLRDALGNIKITSGILKLNGLVIEVLSASEILIIKQ